MNHFSADLVPVAEILSKIRPQTAHNGIWGYKIPKPLDSGPTWTFPKDKSSYLDLESRPHLGNPGPGDYALTKVLSPAEEKERLKRRRVKVDLTKLPKRPNFTDDAVKDSAHVPAPGQYTTKTELFKKVQGSVSMKIDRKSYIDEHVKSNSLNLGPGFLNTKVWK